jgi:O-antigen ligase
MDHSLRISLGRTASSSEATFLAAAAVPTLLAFNEPPSPTLFNQAAALVLWGAAVAVLARQHRTSWLQSTPLQSALGLAALAAAAAGVWAGLPASLALSAVGLIAATMVMVASGVATRGSPGGDRVLTACFAAWLVAGVLSAAIGVIQVFLPDLPDGDLVARSGLEGRAVGNVRQPNHLSSLLLWSAVAVVPLLEAGRLRRAVATALFALMMLGLVLSGSRTGMVGVLVLALWGLFDRRLGRAARTMLISSPIWFSLFWVLMWLWARETQNTFGAAAHVLGAELSSSRFAIWSNTLALIAQHPWAGVGFGEFNFAWSLTPFPDRPVAFFDHTHNLPLQLAVELGLPLATLVLGLLGWALWQAWRRSTTADGATGVALRAAFVMVLMMALHSQLEYPLWYSYFLLPTAWAWGFCLGTGTAAGTPSSGRPRWLFVCGMAMMAAGVAAVADYWRVVQIFAPSDNAPSLSQRIADGQRSLLFAHHADYAAVTTAEDPVTAPGAFDRAPHYLLDTRLMIAWARALAAQGDLDRARHIAQRLREFRNPASDEFFAPCNARASPKPFQCQPPSRVVGWREFR